MVASPGKFQLLAVLMSTTFSEHVHWESFGLLSKGPLIGISFRVKKWGKGRIWYRREQPKYFHLGTYWIFMYFTGHCICLCLRRFIRGSRVRKFTLYLFCSQCCWDTQQKSEVRASPATRVKSSSRCWCRRCGCARTSQWAWRTGRGSTWAWSQRRWWKWPPHVP